MPTDSDGVLESSSPNDWGKLLDRDWHEGDFNLFWFTVEDNVCQGPKSFPTHHNATGELP